MEEQGFTMDQVKGRDHGKRLTRFSSKNGSGACPFLVEGVADKQEATSSLSTWTTKMKT
jgi:hypothetical protein